MTDPEGHNAAEDLDEDRLRLDPLEEGMDPPERWSPAMEEHDTLDDRLGEELQDGEPAPEPRDEVDRMDAAGELSGHPTDVINFSHERENPPEEARRGQSADEGAGSVARDLRTPHESR